MLFWGHKNVDGSALAHLRAWRKETAEWPGLAGSCLVSASWLQPTSHCGECRFPVSVPRCLLCEPAWGPPHVTSLCEEGFLLSPPLSSLHFISTAHFQIFFSFLFCASVGIDWWVSRIPEKGVSHHLFSCFSTWEHEKWAWLGCEIVAGSQAPGNCSHPLLDLTAVAAEAAAAAGATATSSGGVPRQGLVAQRLAPLTNQRVAQGSPEGNESQCFWSAMMDSWGFSLAWVGSISHTHSPHSPGLLRIKLRAPLFLWNTNSSTKELP